MNRSRSLPLLGLTLLLPASSALADVAITRGPYLQLGDDGNVTIRWRTDASVSSRVRFGPAPDQLDFTVESLPTTEEHEIRLTGLEPATLYYYAVGSTAGDLAGADPEHHFRTAPTTGNRNPVRVWVIGDSGTASSSAAAVRDAYVEFGAGRATDLWLMLGDNAYDSGTDAQYQDAVFEMYPEQLRTSVVWPTMGNHDEADSSTGTGPYYDIFTLPAEGEAGGVASGTESYYSFDHANVHFICLNSEDGDLAAPSDMLTWLETDLSTTSQDWIVAYWHHPPYTKGSHDSDSEEDSGGRMVQMRENVLPILEDWGVDLVLAGHSHSYERSYLLDGHYGSSGSLVESMMLDPGDGRVDGDGAYQKETAGPAGHEGAVYVVAGSSGKTSIGPLDHPAMFYSEQILGSVVLDFEGDRLDLTFINHHANVRDHAMLVKNTSVAPFADFEAAPAIGDAPLVVDFLDLSSSNTASWEWDLDGDGTVDSTERNPSWIYLDPGPHTVTLIASNDAGADETTHEDLICVTTDPPGPVKRLALGKDRHTLKWLPVPQAAAYDVARGDLVELLASSGNYETAVTACFASVSGTTLEDGEEPLSDGGLFYLVRATGPCGETGSFANGGAPRPDERDALIEAAGVCP